jgi:hypothetical protein
LALLLYLILTLILLYPFSALNISTQLIGFDGGDLYQGLWNLWWVKHSLLSLSNPYTTIYIFYPLGTDLFAHSLSPIAGIFTIPFQLTVGLVSSYNLLIILSFVLGGYDAYLLAHYITADKKASFFAGIIFGFSAYHLARAGGHLNLASIQWIPLYVLFLLRMRNESSLKNVLLAAVFLVLSTFWADLQYLVFLGLFTSLLLIHDALLERKRIRQYLPRLGLTIIIFLSVAAWVIGPLFYNLLTGKGTYGWPISDESARAREAITWSADLLGFFTPSTSNLFFGNSAQWVTSHFANNGIENIVQIGFVALALTIFAGVKLWK